MEQLSSNRNKMNLSVDYRVVVVALLVVIVGMLVLWRPWTDRVSARDRIITVTGEASVKAAPDEFVFSPSYQFTNADKAAALRDLTAKSNSVVAELKKLGVPSNKIQTNADSWSFPIYKEEGAAPTYTLTLQVTVEDEDDRVQKVQDYLVSTTPTGAVTPQAGFSDAKEDFVENSARDKATKNARTKAEQSAKNLGFRLGAVKSVDDGSGFGRPFYPMDARATTMEAGDSSAPDSLTVQPGENTLNYSVTVTYYIK